VQCRNWASAQVWGVVAAGSCRNLVSWFRFRLSVGYGWNFLSVLVMFMDYPWLAIGFLLESFFVKVKVLKGGFGLWLGDNIVILSMVK
jgi:hypothetical protein